LFMAACNTTLASVSEEISVPSSLDAFHTEPALYITAL